MYPAVTNVIPKGDYLLAIDFDNGENGILDMKPYLNFDIFQRLKKRDAFNHVRVSFDTIEWDSGIDLDPVYTTKVSVPSHNKALQPNRFGLTK